MPDVGGADREACGVRNSEPAQPSASSFIGPKPMGRILPAMDRASIILTAIALAAVIASVVTFTVPGRQALQRMGILQCVEWDCGSSTGRASASK
jgi:hypothetical protein